VAAKLGDFRFFCLSYFSSQCSGNLAA